MRFPEVCLAQVQTVYPAEGKVAVVLKNLGVIDGLRVAVAAPAGAARSGTFDLPQVGDYGVVLFTQDSARSGVWLTGIPSDTWNAVPIEVLAADPLARVTRGRDGSQDIQFSSGDRETTFPDGTLLRVTHTKDGTLGNAGGRVTRTPWHLTERGGDGYGARQAFTPPARPPVDMVIDHASGAHVAITADGSITACTAGGHEIGLRDGMEKIRDAAAPHAVTGTPEQDARRVASEVTVRSAQGHRVVLHDDPELGTDRYVRVQSAGGHRFTLRDKPDNAVNVTILTTGGHTFGLVDAPVALRGATVSTAGGLSVGLQDATRTVTVQGETVVVDASTVKLGSAAASKRVALHLDPTNAQGQVVSSAVKVFGE